MQGVKRLAIGLAASAVLALCAAPALASPLSRALSGAEAAHPNALWHIVHGLCVRDMRASGKPAPCAQVDLDGGTALIKDPQRPTQYLLLPTLRVTGIESPALQAPDSPNYWLAAWNARGLVAKALGRPLPREAVGMAVNSYSGRTQNQLHIHIDCVRADVMAQTAAIAPRLGAHWTPVRMGEWGRRYHARWIADQDLARVDPFKLLARTDPHARADMGRMTLALIPAVRPDGVPGFVLFADRSDDAHDAAAEALLDHHCKAG